MEQGCLLELLQGLAKVRMLRDPHLTETALVSGISGKPQSSVSFPALLVPIGLDSLIDPCPGSGG